MELLAYLFVIGLNLNIIGSGILFLEFARLEIMEVLEGVRRSNKIKKGTNNRTD